MPKPVFTIDPPYEGQRLRHLLLGGMGTGKTTAICDVMAAKPDAHFHVLDSDDAYMTQLAGYPEVLDRNNFTLYVPLWGEWESLAEEAMKAAAAVQPGDFYIFDTVSESWKFIQKHAREQKWWRLDKDGKPKSEDMDWTHVNSDYQELYRGFMNTPGHLLVTADVDPVSEKNDDRATRAVFGPFGVKPKGQKDLWRLFHTVLLMQRSRSQGWTMTTVRERIRSREYLSEVEVGEGDFVERYLKGVAGWRKRPIKTA